MTNADQPVHVENPGALDPSERLRLMRDGLINNLSLLVSGIVGIVLIPLMLKGLGAEFYGLWVVVITTASLVAMFDFGLFSTVAREVSSAPLDQISDDTRLFVEGAANAYLLLGVAEALLLGALGYFLSGRLHLDAKGQREAHAVFWLVGWGLLTDQLSAWSSAVLIGLRRFDWANWIGSGAAIFRAVGILALLAMGYSLVPIALWHAISSTVGAIVALGLIARLFPRFRLRIARLHWKRLRQRVSFAISSMVTFALGNLTWQSGSLLISFVLGSARVVPFYVGQKFPLSFASVSWQAAETLFPAASQNRANLPRTRELLKVGTRWVLVLALPVCILLLIAGPSLLSVWMGNLDPDALLVLRLVSAAVVADAFMVAPLNILWGRGEMGKVVTTLACVLLGTVCLTLVLLPRIGVTGAAWGTLLPMVAGAVLLFHLACRECQASSLKLASSVLRGLLVPAAGCAASAYVVSAWAEQGPWSLAGSCFAGSLAYVLGLYLATGQSEEKLFLQVTFRQVRSLPRLANRRLRRVFY